MSKLTRHVEKERVDFIFDVPLTEVVLNLNKLIKKYSGDATLGERYDWGGFGTGDYYCVSIQEQESDEAHEDRLKYNSTMEFAEREELRRLQEKYPLQKYPLDIPS
jgi:hypothetical protein